MSKISDGGFSMGPGLSEQMSTFHKFEATSLEQFKELMKVLDHMSGEKIKEQKLKDELRNLKGPKKELKWKTEI